MELQELLGALRRLHDRIRSLVVEACEKRTPVDLARVVQQGAGDVTYAVDVVSESALVDWLAREVASREPIVLVGEGLPGGRLTLPAGAAAADARWRIIVDPIDGTRGLMYQKRPAWILTGVALNRDEETSLSHIELALQTEIPLVKQHLSDQLWALRGAGAQGVRYNRLTDQSQPLVVTPSSATDIGHGFATICRFFPGGRDVLAAIDDEFCERLLGPAKPGEAAVFNDQYASTGGQIYGLAMGQDRFIADLRPLLVPLVRSRGQPGLFCHPYDIATKLIAEEAGVIVTDASGRELSTPFDIESSVAWIGYANEPLRAAIEPVLQKLLQEHRLC